MIKLFENNNSGDTGATFCNIAVLLEQTFTPMVSHTITNLRLKLNKSISLQSFTVSLYSTSGGHYSGSPLVSIAPDMSSINAAPGSWIDNIINVTVSAGLSYAIVLESTGSGIVQSIFWRYENSHYTRGIASAYTSGAWITLSHDFMFECWGISDTFRVLVNGVPVQGNPYIQKDSVYIDDTLEERVTASFVVVDSNEQKSYVKGQPIEIYDDDNYLIFSGYIDSVSSERIGPSRGHYHTVNCVDNYYLAEKRRLAESYVSQTAGYIVTDILINILANEGVLLGEIQAGVTMPTFVSNRAKVSDALDALKEKCGFIWYISFDKKLYFISRDSNTAPWKVTPDFVLKSPAPSLDNSNPDYRNQQYITGGKAQTDQQTESFNGDGSSITFSLQYSVAATPTITVNGVSQTVGIKDVDSGAQWYWEADSEVITQDNGGTKLLAADTLQVVYYGYFDIVVMVNDETAIATQSDIEASSGIVEDATEDTDIESIADGLASAQAKIDFYCMQGQQFEFTTYKSGLRSGQLVTVYDPNFGLYDEEMLIESIQTKRTNNHFEYTIKAVIGPEQGSWSKLFKSIADKATDTDLSIGNSENLVILKEFEETIEDIQTLTSAVYACPVPGPTLYPSPTLYPC